MQAITVEGILKKLKAEGRTCHKCGTFDIVTFSIPSAEGVPFTLEEIGEKCLCKNCLMLMVLPPQGAA